MAKIRGVKPEYWTDEAIVELSIPARLLFIGLWNYACDNGHLDDKPKQIKMRLFPADDIDVDLLLSELEEHGRITRVAGVITIPKFADHQKPHKRWWTTCDQPLCTVPDDAPQQGRNGGATVEQPLSNGGATVTDVTDGDGDGDRRDKSRNRRAPERDLPDDWQPTAAHETYAKTNGLDISREAFKFRNHAQANGRRQRDWDAAFRMWLAKATDYAPARPATRSANDQRPEGW